MAVGSNGSTNGYSSRNAVPSTWNCNVILLVTVTFWQGRIHSWMANRSLKLQIWPRLLSLGCSFSFCPTLEISAVSPIGSCCMVYLPTFTIKINHSWIGKYTVRPMDGMGRLLWRYHEILRRTGSPPMARVLQPKIGWKRHVYMMWICNMNMTCHTCSISIYKSFLHYINDLISPHDVHQTISRGQWFWRSW